MKIEASFRTESSQVFRFKSCDRRQERRTDRALTRRWGIAYVWPLPKKSNDPQFGYTNVALRGGQSARTANRGAHPRLLYTK